MKTALYYNYGNSNELQIVDIGEPEIEPKHVLVKIHAVGINPFDWKIRKGELDIWSGFKFPKIPGLEATGEIIKIGNEVETFNTGDKVILCTGIKGGCCAEYYSAKENQLYKMPEGISYNEAAASSITGLTALQAIRDIAYVNSETRILINGASGGVGVAAVQIAKIFEGNVTALCSASNMELVKSLDADDIFDYKTTDILTRGIKYNAVFDTIGNLNFSDYKKILNKGGVFISTTPDP
jgi:NADPH:quinone reductase and related Zn-dependent oxidoreductases